MIQTQPQSIQSNSASHRHIRTDRLHCNAPLIVFFALVLAIVVAAHQHLNRRFDFGVFYFAAHMVLDGARHSLYDINAQHTFQTLYQRPPDTLFRNPPFALLPILPLAKLPMAAAFALWTIFSLGLLYAILRVLENETQIHFGNWPLLLAPAFAPVLGSFLHGQFSLVVVAAYTAAYALWRRGRHFLGGLILAIATIKFQAVLGLVLILALKRKGRELAGLSLGCAVLLAISLRMVGLNALLAYPHFLLHSDTPLSELPHMANWQGFLTILGVNHWLLVLPLSLGTILCAEKAWKDLDRGFAAAILASVLVSYHLTPQDLSLLLIPFYLGIKSGILPQARVPVFTLTTIASTLAMVILHVPLAFLALPVAIALGWIATVPIQPAAISDTDQTGRLRSRNSFANSPQQAC